MAATEASRPVAVDDVPAWVGSNWSLELSLGDWWQRLAEAGLAFPTWPVGLGGFGASLGEARKVGLALAAAGVVGPPTGIGPSMGAPTLIGHGTPEQQIRFIPPLVAGKELWCQLFSEPGAGSDLASLMCKAERVGEHFVIEGQKVWNSSADLARWGLLLARTNSQVPKHAGITFMMIDMHQPGIEARPLVQMNGAAEFCEVFIDKARVPIENVVGEVDGGWLVARTTLSHERAGIGTRRSPGMFLVAPSDAGKLDEAVGQHIERIQAEAAMTRRRRDVMIGHKSMVRLAQDTGKSADPVWRDRVAQYWIHSRVHQLTLQRSRDNNRSGKPGATGSITKLSLAMLAHHSRDLSMVLLGASGMLMGDCTWEQGRVQLACLSSPAPSIGGGTNQIQRNIIGERTLGLPREPAVGADEATKRNSRS